MVQNFKIAINIGKIAERKKTRDPPIVKTGRVRFGIRTLKLSYWSAIYVRFVMFPIFLAIKNELVGCAILTSNKVTIYTILPIPVFAAAIQLGNWPEHIIGGSSFKRLEFSRPYQLG